MLSSRILSSHMRCPTSFVNGSGIAAFCPKRHLTVQDRAEVTPASQERSARQFAGVVIANHIDFVRVVAVEPARVFQARPPLRVIRGSLRRQNRNGVVVGRKLDSKVIGVSDVQQPAVATLNRCTAMAECVAEQRDKKYPGFESNGQWKRSEEHTSEL